MTISFHQDTCILMNVNAVNQNKYEGDQTGELLKSA